MPLTPVSIAEQTNDDSVESIHPDDLDTYTETTQPTYDSFSQRDEKTGSQQLCHHGLHAARSGAAFGTVLNRTNDGYNYRCQKVTLTDSSSICV